KRDRLLKEHPGEVTQEQFLPREQWFVLKAKRPGVSARALAKQYGLEELRDYLTRSRTAIDKMRGRGVEGRTATERRVMGSARGRIEMAADFNAPLPEDVLEAFGS